MFETETWTIMTTDGTRAIDFKSFVNLDVTSENPVTQAPIERGGFVDYNRVVAPLQLGLMLSVEGTPEHLQSVVDQIDAICSDVSLVNILTPYYEFKNYAMEKYQYSQDASSGVSVLYFNFSFVQVREVVSQYTNARVSKSQPRGQQPAQETSILSSVLSGF